MTQVLERWWAPNGTVPVDRLLTPGSDPQKDLGLALFGLHRAGAEACELVAKTAVADEAVLAAALAETRAVLAGDAVQTIAKAVGGPQYAGLLLKDLLDDAEVAALALYRTCLAKSVAPPIAAERVGMVFGVPSRELSRYAHLASDPKANPRAVQDLADRTLFDYVSKVVTEEYEPAKETFSKAPVRENFPDDEDYLGQHNVQNGPHGRFIREGGEVLPGTSLQDLFNRAEQRQRDDAVRGPEVAPAQAPVTTGPQVGRIRRQKRLKRQQRAVRTTDESAPIAQQQMAQHHIARQSVLQMKLTKHEIQAQHLVSLGPPPLPLGGLDERSVGDTLAAKWPAGVGTPIGRSVSFILPDSEYASLGRAAGDVTTGEHIVRIGALEEYAGKARLYDQPGGTTDAHQAGLEHVMTMITKKPEYQYQPDLRFAEVPVATLAATGDAEKALEAAKRRFIEMMKEKHYPKLNVDHEVGSVDNAPDINRRDMMILIWRPPGKDPEGNVLAARPIPRMVSMVVAPGAVTGTVTGNQIELSGNDPVKMKSLFHRFPGANRSRRNEVGDMESLTFWDSRLGAIISTVHLTKGTEDEVHRAWERKRGGTPGSASKADSDYLDEHNVVNDTATGRFVREREPLTRINLQQLFDQAEEKHQVVQPKAPRKMARLRRMKRQQREVRPTPAQDAVQGIAPQQLSRQKISPQKLARQAIRAQHIRDKTDPAQTLVHFDPMVMYTALDPFTMDRMVRAAGYRNAPAEGIDWPITVNAAMQHVLFQETSQTGYPADLRINENTIATWNGLGKVEEPRQEERVFRTLFDPAQGGELAQAMERASIELQEATKGDSKVQALRAKFTKRGKLVELQVFGNTAAMPAQHLLRYSPEANPSKPRRLTPDRGLRRTQNAATLADWLEQTYWSMVELKVLDIEDERANPKVKTWLVE